MNILFKKINFFKSKKNLFLKSFATFLLSRGIKSNLITVLSLISGLISVFYFSEKNTLFLIFFLISVVMDLLDGAVAVVEKKDPVSQKRGVLFDDISDRTVYFLLLLKISYLLESLPAFLIAVAFLLIKTVHIVLKQFRSPNIQIIYFDRLSLVFLLVSYDAFFQVIVLVLFINILELINILQE